MKKILLFIAGLLSATAFNTNAQTPNFSQDIAPIIYAHCSTCHHAGSIAPDPLMTYFDVSTLAPTIMNYVDTRVMPPWPPDPNYTALAHQRVLTPQEIQTIDDWVGHGAPQGDSTLAPPLPVFNDGPQITNPDVSVRIPTYTVTSPQDVYRCFAIPSGLSAARFVQSLEIVPGTRSIVHHVLIFYDTTGQCLKNDEADPLPGYSCFGGTGCNNASLIGIWVPGSSPQTYPQGMGVPLTANGYFVLEIHYAPGSEGFQDSTRLNIKLTPNNFVRPISISYPLNYFNLLNGPLVIPADSMRTFYAKYTVPAELSVLSVGPHMHLIGQQIKVYAFDPSAPADTIHLINIPAWDFRWQGLYFFPKIMKINTGTVVQSDAFYNNTDSNLNNPNYPPEIITAGENTDDEMMLVFFAYTPYFPGDENIIQDSSMFVATGISNVAKPKEANIIVYPNPTSGNATMYLKLAQPAQASLRLLDLSGRLIKQFWTNQSISQPTTTYPLDLENTSNGIYLLDYESGGAHNYTKICVER